MKLSTEVKKQGKTSQLYVAAYHVKLDEVQSYLAEGADPNEVLTEKIDGCAYSSVGETPLYGVVSGIMEHGFTDDTWKTADALIKAGADVNYKNKEQDGNTILRMAVDLNAKEMVMILIGHGADPGLKNDDGIDAYTQARLGYNQDLIELMEACRNRYHEISAVDKRSYKEAIKQLEKFSEREDISAILKILYELESSSGVEDEIIESLRRQLNAILIDKNSDDVTKGDLSLSDASYNALLALAEFSPINANDPITLDEIDKDNLVVVSTGHQFDIVELIKYHNTRYYRGSSLGESSDSKWLLNPITNAKFSSRDVAHIQSVSEQKGILIQHLKIERQPVAEHAAAHGLFQQQGISGIQREAINRLQAYGLTIQHLQGREWFNNGEHLNALGELMVNRNMSADDAMAELDGLSREQATGIYDGLTRQEVLEQILPLAPQPVAQIVAVRDFFQQAPHPQGLTNAQAQILERFQQHGLTVEHVQGKDWTNGYIPALQYLFTERNMNVNEVMAEIDGLDFYQAQRIADGETRAQILGNGLSF